MDVNIFWMGAVLTIFGLVGLAVAYGLHLVLGRRKMSNLFTSLLLGAALLGASLIVSDVATSDSDIDVDGPKILTVHYIDVDQGDAILIEAPDATVLIDAGRHDRNDVIPYLQSVGVTDIDLLIGTHPHADHIGQFPQVLESFPVREVWLSGDTHTSRTFERAVDAILASDAGYHEPRVTDAPVELGSLLIEVVHPERVDGHLNNGSIGLRITFEDATFLFTGDAEAEAEAEMIERGHNLRADILKLGHHGSRTSSTQGFLDAVQPQIAIYSAGKDNSYHHPHEEVIARLHDMNIAVFGTDVHGTIRVISDGQTYRLELERNVPARAPPETADIEVIVGGCLPGQVDINSADASELTQIIHIGVGRAEALIMGRPYSSLDDLTNIPGIGRARLNDIQEQGIACVGGL